MSGKTASRITGKHFGAGAALIPGLLLAAAVANFSGTWALNVEKSSWGKRARPVSVTVTVQHDEPSLKYSGTVNSAPESQTAQFSFEGAIDGKPYPVVGGNTGGGAIVFKRVNANTVESEAKSADGRIVETAWTTIAPDGKTLRRRVRLRAPDGETAWTEVYEKR